MLLLRTGYASARWAAFLFSFAFLWTPFSLARSVNVTVDDLFGSFPVVGGHIVFAGDWTQKGAGFSRDDFSNPPGFDGTVNGTWHSSTRNRGSTSMATASLQFRGTAVYVRCVLNRDSLDGPANSEMYFTIDDEPTQTFIRPALPSASAIITTVFLMENLTPKDHRLFIRNGPKDGPLSFGNIAIFLDAITYTTIDDDFLSNSNNSSPTKSLDPTFAAPASTNITNSDIIVTSVCATTVVVATIAFLLYRRMRQRFQRQIAVLKSSPLSPPTSPIRPFPANRYSFPISDSQSLTQPSSPPLSFDTLRPTEEAVRPGRISPGPTNNFADERTSPLPSQSALSRWPTQSSQRSSGSLPPPSYHTRASTAENPFLDVAPEPMPDRRRAV